MNAIPVVLLGAGPWGRTIAAAISATPEVSLAAVVSSSPETRQWLGAEIPVVSDWQTAIDATDARGVVMAIPPMHQAKFAVELIEHGIPVMLEKPMSASVADACAIRLAARKHGFTGLVNHLHVHAPYFRKLLAHISTLPGPKVVQSIAGARGPCRDQWSPLWDWAGHDLAMALSAIDSETIEISAQADVPVNEGDRQYQNFHIDLAFSDSSRAMFHLGNAFERKIREFCVSTDDGAGCYQETERGEITVSLNGVDADGISGIVKSRPLNAALITFAERIRRGGGIEDIEMGTVVVRLIDAAESSIRFREPISLKERG